MIFEPVGRIEVANVTTLVFVPGEAAPAHSGHREDVNDDGVFDFADHSQVL